MKVAIILCKTRQKNHTVVDFTMCHSQYNLCDLLVNITMKTPLDLSLLFLRTFLTTRWLPSLTVPLGSETRVTPIFLDLINAWWFNILSFASL